jgi:hypothetical protein
LGQDDGDGQSVGGGGYGLDLPSEGGEELSHSVGVEVGVGEKVAQRPRFWAVGARSGKPEEESVCS